MGNKKNILIPVIIVGMLVSSMGIALAIDLATANKAGPKAKVKIDLPVIADINLAENSGEKDIMDESLDTFLDSIGMKDKENIAQTDTGGLLVGDVAKEVHSYKSLAEGEEDMGFYLGLHNQIKSQPGYNLVGLYRIGEGEWYQAIYSAEPDNNQEANTEYPDITMKVTRDYCVIELLEAYETDNYTYYDKDIEGVSVRFHYKSDAPDKINIASFELDNDKSYSLFTSVGVKADIIENIATELVNNLKIMDDWV